MKLKICPVCKKEMQKSRVALLRYDNKTEICPKCGMAESLFMTSCIIIYKGIGHSTEAYLKAFRGTLKTIKTED